MGDHSEYWINLLNMFLHDPPDKALDIQHHESRCNRYLEAAGVSVTDVIKDPDWISSAIERLPMPKERLPALKIGVENGSLSVRHPVSGGNITLQGLQLNENFIVETIRKIAAEENDERNKFFLLWRLLPGMLAEQENNFHYLMLPAETRAPDHTIWHHCDTAAAFYPSFLDAEGNGAALLSFQLGPVQEFIATARTLRDLWTGSMTLSWLTFQAMLPVIQTFGPTALVFPALRGMPFMDTWMLDEGGLGLISATKEDLKRRLSQQPVKSKFGPMRRSPCLPNKFLAVVPWGAEGKPAKEIAVACENAARNKWIEMADAVRKSLANTLSSVDTGWDNRWDQQIDNFFDVKTSLLPLKNATPDTISEAFSRKSIDEMYDNVRLINGLFDTVGGAAFDKSGRRTGIWQAQLELSARLMEAKRAVRHVPPDAADNDNVPPKCSMMGSYEQMGPAGLEESRKFWEAASRFELNGVRLRSRERLSAVALVKRFAFPAYLKENLKFDRLGFHDTATVAAQKWLVKEPIIEPDEIKGWSGQWLHWPSPESGEKGEPNIPEGLWKRMEEKKKMNGKPPAYYAILAMDADGMGKWLRGDNAAPIGDIYHPRIIGYLKEMLAQSNASKEKIDEYLNAKRPLAPSAHMAISESLTNFAAHVAPEIVENLYGGALVYAGGDDVLAFLPVECVVACANALYRAFQGKEGNNGGAAHKGFYKVENRDFMMMGDKATLSAGIAVAHYKEDLRFALDKARSAEKMAKNAGRNRLALSVLRRSGEHATAVMDWGFADIFNEWVDAFKKDASDRWIYHLRAELPTLEGAGLPEDLMKSEIKRQLNRAEMGTREKFGGTEGAGKAGENMAALFGRYCALRRERTKADGPGTAGGRLLGDFITILQSASFFARGRD